MNNFKHARTNTMKKTLTGLSLLLTAAYASGAAASGGDTLLEDEYLFPTQELVASGCYYRAVMQSDGNFVNYGGNHALWASNTVGSGGYAGMQADGNFEIYNWADRAVWSTHTNGNWDSSLIEQGDGNLVLYSSAFKALWSSRTNGESLGQSPCTLKQERTFVTYDFDRPGGDYKIVIPTLARASWCGFFCANESACKAYSYVPPSGSGTGECHLKNVINTRVRHWGWVAGMKEF
jgi:hypothetical protein